MVKGVCGVQDGGVKVWSLSFCFTFPIPTSTHRRDRGFVCTILFSLHPFVVLVTLAVMQS